VKEEKHSEGCFFKRSVKIKENMVIKVIQADITKLGKDIDAIVNAANESLLGGGGVDGAIHYAAGPELLKECMTLNGCKPGEAKVTKAYKLPYKYIIHTVGPRYYSDPNPPKTLESCYLNCLKIADELGLETIVFPSISTGVFGYPVEEAAEVVAKVLTSYKAKTLKTVYMCIYFDEETAEIYRSTIERYSI